MLTKYLKRSPTGAHPDLHIRLTAPEEPGFFLQKVPVQNMKEVWGILEVRNYISKPHGMSYGVCLQIVKEQCWLNEILNSCQWIAEGLTTAKQETIQEDDVTEAELQAVLDGTISIYIDGSFDKLIWRNAKALPFPEKYL
jgi:hypothetical protein